MRFKTLVPGLRVLPVHLVPHPAPPGGLLRRGGRRRPSRPGSRSPFIQEEEKEDADAAVVFPEPLAKGAMVRLRLSYKGDKVLRDGGDKNYFVGARESWYPNLGVFSDPAIFDLTYRVPAGNEIVSVGSRIEERTEGAQSVSRWKTDHPVQVAGFNYGKFKKMDKVDETSGIDVAGLHQPRQARHHPRDQQHDERRRRARRPGRGLGAAPSSGSGPSLGNVNTAKLAEASLADGLNSARLFTAYFGPLPQTHVAITQQSDFAFGQSWPSLIFLPYISFLDGTQRQRLGHLAGQGLHRPGGLSTSSPISGGATWWAPRPTATSGWRRASRSSRRRSPCSTRRGGRSTTASGASGARTSWRRGPATPWRPTRPGPSPRAGGCPPPAPPPPAASSIPRAATCST